MRSFLRADKSGSSKRVELRMKRGIVSILLPLKMNVPILGVNYDIMHSLLQFDWTASFKRRFGCHSIYWCRCKLWLGAYCSRNKVGIYCFLVIQPRVTCGQVLRELGRWIECTLDFICMLKRRRDVKRACVTTIKKILMHYCHNFFLLILF